MVGDLPPTQRSPLGLHLLPTINVGGAASTVGALLGSLLGALHGWTAFPTAWREGLEDTARLEAQATTFLASL